MRFRVVAVPENEFNDWLAYQSAPAIESPDALALSDKRFLNQQDVVVAMHSKQS